MLILLKHVKQFKLGLHDTQLPTLFAFIDNWAFPKHDRQFDGEPTTHVAQFDVQGRHAGTLFTIWIE